MTSRTSLFFSSLVLLLTLVCVSQAQATPTTFDIVFSADFGYPAQWGIISGEFLATFDPAIDAYGTPYPILPWVIFSPDKSSLDNFIYTAATTTINAHFTDAAPISYSWSGFGVHISGFTGVGPALIFDGAQQSYNGWTWWTQTGTARLVPVPPSLVLLGTGLVGLAGWGRFRMR